MAWIGQGRALLAYLVLMDAGHKRAGVLYIPHLCFVLGVVGASGTCNHARG